MTHTQTFIELAIEGGAIDQEHREMLLADSSIGRASLCRVLLDPLAWQAVGKARGWTDDAPHTTDGYPWASSGWLCYWHRFIDLIAEDKNIESALETILK